MAACVLELPNIGGGCSSRLGRGGLSERGAEGTLPSEEGAGLKGSVEEALSPAKNAAEEEQTPREGLELAKPTAAAIQEAAAAAWTPDACAPPPAVLCSAQVMAAVAPTTAGLTRTQPCESIKLTPFENLIQVTLKRIIVIIMF
ncbi:hypothetical protein MTO96_019826 [Rhipicephalus appendiculatus]